jgi:predicted dehydrogenase
MASRAAIIGFGAAAEKTHAPAYLKRSDIEIAACVEPSPDRREAFLRLWPWARVFESTEDLVGSGLSLDFVDVATPPAHHEAAVLPALDAGWNVLCEKPLAPNRSAWEALEGAARRSGKNLLTIHNWAYAPHWLKVREVLDSGVLGAARHVQIRCLRTRPSSSATGSWRSSADLGWGGVSVDHGWHSFYLIRRCLGSELEDASFSLESASPDAVDESASVFLRCENGKTGFVYLTWRASIRLNAAVVDAERGVIEVKDGAVEVRLRDSDLRHFDFKEKLSAGSSHPEWFSTMIDDYLPALAGGKTAAAAENLAESRFCSAALGRVLGAPYRDAAAPEVLAR